MFKRIHSDHFNSSSASHQDGTRNSQVRLASFTCNSPLLKIFFSSKLLLMEDFYSWTSRFKTVELMRRVFLVFPHSFQQRRMMVRTRRLDVQNTFKHNNSVLCLNMSGDLSVFLPTAATTGRGDTTQLTVSSLDESRHNISQMELQPEDEDEELEMTLRSHGCSLAELYPSMINRLKQAWSRHHASEAADSVLRRYRRWRQQPNRSGLNKTFCLPLSQKTTSEERLGSPLKIRATPESLLKIATARQHSYGRMRREQLQPILVMDLCCTSESTKSKGFSLNQTFNVSEREEQPSSLAFSLSRPLHPPQELSLRSKRLSVAAHSPQADGSSMYVRSTSAGTERPDAFGSPLRQSPLKATVVPSLSRSPRASWRSPAARSVEGFSREPVGPRSMSDSPPSSPKMLLRMLCPQDSHLSLRSQPSSPVLASASGRHRLRRHLSFDSSLPTSRASYSPKQLDEEFIKLYHRFVCQNKSSFFHGPPCRFCARSFELSRSHSSSSLAALALSPHRSLLRKRHRELSWGSHPQSKRLRDEYYASSPGSKRRVKEMLRRRLSPFESEQPRDGFSFSSSNCSLMSRFSAQQHEPQDTWLSRGHSVSAGEFSDLGEHHPGSY